MAKRKPKAKTDKKAKTEPAKPSDVMKMPSEATVRSIAADITSTLKARGKLSDELAEVIAEAKKSKGIHPSALKRVERWLTKAKKTDRGLFAVATELAHLDFYRDVLGLTKMLDEQGQMFARSEAEAEADKPPRAGPLFSGPAARVKEIAQQAGAAPGAGE